MFNKLISSSLWLDQKSYHWILWLSNPPAPETALHQPLCSFSMCTCSLVLSQRFKRTSMSISSAPFLHSSLLSGVLPSKFPAASNYDICFHCWVLCLGSLPLYLDLESASRQKAGIIIGFTSFVSLFSGIKVLCCLLSKVWKHLLQLFCSVL